MSEPSPGPSAVPHRLPAGAYELWAILSLVAVVVVAVILSDQPSAALLRDAALPIHIVAGMLYVAGATAIFHVAWFAPRGDYRLRPTLVACACVPVIAFDMLHVLTYPGMPDFLGANGQLASDFYKWLARASLPLVLLALQFRSDTTVPTGRLRWSILLAVWACVLPLAWYGASFGGNADARGPQFALVALYLGAAAVIARYGGQRIEARLIVLAAALVAAGQILDTPGSAKLGVSWVLVQAFDLFAVGIAFLATYADAVDIPYRSVDRLRREALRSREQLEAIFNSVAEGVIVVDTSMNVAAMNPVARHLVGGASGPVRGIPLRKALGSAEGAAVAEILDALDNALSSGQARSARGSFSGWSVGDTPFVLNYSVSPIRDRQRRITGAILALRDVTAHWRLTEDLRDGADYARGLIDAGIDAIVVIGMDGTIADANGATSQLLGQPRHALVGSDFHSHFQDPQRVREALAQVFPDGAVRNLPLFAKRADGGSTEVACNITPYRNAAGEVCGAFAIARDATEQRQAQLTLEYQATCDALTAMPNRRAFRQRVVDAAAKALETDSFVAVMVVNVDDFKDINDALGHLVGDDLLKGVGRRLTLCLGNGGLVARIGGDEFGILVPALPHAGKAEAIAEKILAAVNAPIMVEGGEVMVSCSMGVSVFPLGAGDDPGSLVRSANTAMHLAKEGGKGKCRHFTPDMGESVRRRVDLGTRLRGALQRDELFLHYQPQAELASGTIVGVEALLRWNAPGIGLVAPLEFVPIAEDSGLILPIGEWVLRQACRDAAHWRRETGRDLTVAVNLSARQFRDGDIVASVIAALEESGLPPQLLELELTESLLVRDADGVAATLHALKNLGASIAIDDFGTGYSSLAYLKRFPLDYLKIDRAFVMGVPGNRNDEAIVRTIVALAHNLGLQVIAEGVATEAQLAFLQHLGCSEVQGYHISRPIPADRVLELLSPNDTALADATGISEPFLESLRCFPAAT